MLPEQIPGTLFIILLALVAYATGQWDAILLLALGCAAGWASFAPEEALADSSRWTALGFWALSFVLISIRIIF